MDEQEYKLTPKGAAYAVLLDMDMIKIDCHTQIRIQAFWDKFSAILCRLYGYKSKEELWNTVKNGGRKDE